MDSQVTNREFDLLLKMIEETGRRTDTGITEIKAILQVINGQVRRTEVNLVTTQGDTATLKDQVRRLGIAPHTLSAKSVVVGGVGVAGLGAVLWELVKLVISKL